MKRFWIKIKDLELGAEGMGQPVALALIAGVVLVALAWIITP